MEYIQNIDPDCKVWVSAASFEASEKQQQMQPVSKKITTIKSTTTAADRATSSASASRMDVVAATATSSTCCSKENGSSQSACCSNPSPDARDDASSSSPCCSVKVPPGSKILGTPFSGTDVDPNLLPPTFESDDEEEEDIINNAYVTMDHVPDLNGEEESSVDDADDQSDGGAGAELFDMEDLGSKMSASKKRELKNALTDSMTHHDPADKQVVVRREMVTKLQRKALTKEGYRIIGSHSAVKLCRWTKNQMRGRGE